MEQIKQNVAKKLSEILEKEYEETYSLIEKPKDSSMGDFAYPCFKLAKEFRKAPFMIAEEIKTKILQDMPEAIKKIEAVAGYLNFFTDNSVVVKNTLSEILDKKEGYLCSNIGEGKTICIDYSSPNIAKPFHIGHLRSTVIGGAIYKLYKALGYNVVGINYLGDFGTQFGYVIEGFKRFGSEEKLLEAPIKHLVEIYVKINELAKEDEEIVQAARRNFKALEDGEEETTNLWKKFRSLSLEEYERVYKRLNASFDSYNGEAYYNDKMQEVVDMLENKNLLTLSEGAKVVELEGYNIPCMIIKSNGSTTYATRDLAAILDRSRTYDYYKSIYVTSYEQILHFNEVFEVAKNIVDEKYTSGLVHVPFGMVLGPGGKKLSTRKGASVTLEDVLNESVEKALSILKEKGKVTDNIEETADIIGIGAIIFNDLKNNRIKDEIFDIDEMLKFEGETGPYVQYTYVRTNSILSKVNFDPNTEIDYSLLKEKEEIELIKTLAKARQIIKTAAEEYEPSILTRYIIDVASGFSKYYNEHQIITDNKELTEARCALIYATGLIIKEGMNILGIKCPERM